MVRVLLLTFLLTIAVSPAITAAQAVEGVIPLVPAKDMPTLLVGESNAVSDEVALYVPRNPLYAAALSALLPGGGQFYNKEFLKGGLVVGAELYGTVAMFLAMMAHDSDALAPWVLPIAYAYSVVDAGWNAHTYNQRMANESLVPVTPPKVSNHLSAGVYRLIGNNELSGFVGEVEWRPTPTVGVSVAYSNRAGSVGVDTLTMASLRLYAYGDTPHQLYVGLESGMQDRSSPNLYNFKYCYKGVTAGATLRPVDLPVELRVSFGKGISEGITGYVYKGRYSRWTGGLALVF